MPVSGIKIQKANDDVLTAQVHFLAVMKRNLDEAQARYEEVQANLIKELEARGRKTLVDEVTRTKVTVVTRDIPKYDEKGLAKALGASLWNKITKKTLDKAKLEKAVDEGEIDINVIAQHTTVTPAKPHLRFSAVLPDEQ